MRPPETNELLLIRHAPADHGGRLCGRTDVPALLPPEPDLAPLRGWLSGCSSVVSSPARRCVQTAGALFPETVVATDERLWEQDFGAHDGLRFSDLPDLGVLDRAGLVHGSAAGREKRYLVDEAQLARAVAQLSSVGSAWDARLQRIKRIAETIARTQGDGDTA